MPAKKTPSFFYALLNVLLRVSDGIFFRPLHRLVLWSYRLLLLPLLGWLLRRRLPAIPAQLVLRQSAASGIAFNVFASDIDLAVILSGAAEESDFVKIRDLFRRAKRFVPSIGELKIYFVDEWERRSQLQTAHGHWFSHLRAWRKLHWMERAYQEAPTAYHRQKSLRSIQNIFTQWHRRDLRAQPQGNLARLSADVVRSVTNQFGPATLAEIAAQFPFSNIEHFSPFLDATISTAPSRPGKETMLRLPPPVAAALLAAIPMQRYASATPVCVTVQQLRARFPEIVRTFSEVAEWDLLNLGGYLRGLTVKEKWMKPLLETTRDELGREGPVEALVRVFGGDWFQSLP